ncbi:MAG: hypothetical protein COB37_07465 [Kordiimonadales bacterium]|nr:MAG: hypothetical protein COB37_07465 [Kordiimonadales bacterium]
MLLLAVTAITFAVSFSAPLFARAAPLNARLEGTEKPETIEVAFIEFWPICYTENGVAKGQWIDAIRTLLHATNRVVNFTEYPVRRMFKMVETGQTHIGIYAPKAGYDEKTVLISYLPLAHLEVRVYATQEATLNELTSVFDLKNESLIAIDGFNYAGIRRRLETSGRNIRLMDASGHQSAVAMLRASRARFMLGYNKSVTRVLTKFNGTPLFSKSVRLVPLSLVVSKTVDNHEELFQILEARTRGSALPTTRSSPQ